MNGVDFANKINRQDEIYRRNLDDQRNSHAHEVDSLKKASAHRLKDQSETHKKQVSSLEKGHNESLDRVKTEQKKSLAEKSKSYEKALNKNKKEFHEERSDNIRNWNKKFAELKESFSNNMEDTKTANKTAQSQLRKNYNDNLANVREQSNRDLNAFLETKNKEKKESDIQFRTEKNRIVRDYEKELSDLKESELDQRNFLKKTAVKDVADSRALQEKRFLNQKDLADSRFKKMYSDVNAKIDKDIIEREDRLRESQIKENKNQNKAFSERYNNLAKDYNNDVRELEYKARVKEINNNDINKEIQAKYKDNQRKQMDTQKEIHMNERLHVEETYGKKMNETVESYQQSLRDRNISNAEKLAQVESKLTEINREDRYNDKIDRERMQHDHQVALKYVTDQSSSKEADQKRNTNEKINKLKENYNTSLKDAQKKSDENFELARKEMIEDKRELQKRLHEQNAQQNADIRKMHFSKMNIMTNKYEKRIQELEVQNEMIQQNANDMIKDVMRKTSFEIDRQRKESMAAAKTQVDAERQIGQEKEANLTQKIRDLEKNFSSKMNNQNNLHRQKMKETQFQADQKLKSESQRLQTIIDQNNKFFAREFQRLKLASETERQRLVTQYEDRIAKLQKVYKNQADELEQYNKLNTTSA